MHLVREAFLILGLHQFMSDLPQQIHVDFNAGLVTFQAHLPNGHWPRQVTFFNPLSPNNHLQILQTDLNTFSYRIS